MSELDQRAQDVLRARAKRLAERQSTETIERDLCRVLIVSVAGSDYAVPLAQISEVRPFRERVPVPGAPRECLGLVNVRNELRAVIDFGVLLSQAEARDDGYLIFPRTEITEGRQVGLRVDALGDIYDLDRGELGPLVASGEGASLARQGVDPRGNSLLDLKFLFLGKGDDR